ncbi:hypothetical protein B0H19DRAFT_1040486 [Mycena capillaripes]|nr:hypothetical protein B0H19DRAFT_1040486 [Mycena capillaripes]
MAPITEIVTVDLIAPYTYQSIPLVKLLQILAQRQSAHSAYPVRFFTDTKSSSRIYIVSGWHDVRASQEWLQSPGWLEVAALLKPFRTVKGRTFLAIDFDTIPRRGVVCIRRGTRISRSMNRGSDKTGTFPSAFWDASADELSAQANATYSIEVYMDDAWKARGAAKSAEVSMWPFTLSQLYD